MKSKKNYLTIIKKIENIRKKNNVNWMNLLRLAFNTSPKKPLLLCQRFIWMMTELVNQ